MTTYHNGMELGDWQRGAQDAARYDIGLSKISLQQTPLPSYGDVFRQNVQDSVRVSNQDAASFNLGLAYDEVNDKIKAATGASDLFNPITSGDPILPAGKMIPDPQTPEEAEARLPGPERWNRVVGRLREKHPDALNWDEILAEPTRRARTIMKETRDKTDEMNQRLGLIEPGQIPYVGNIPLVGATAALASNATRAPIEAVMQFAGGMTGAMTSPVDGFVNFISGLAGREALSIVNNAFRAAAANAAAQMPLSALKQSDYRDAGLPTGWRVWLSEVEGAAAAGFLLDAGVRAPVRAARRAMGAQDLGGVFLDAVPRANLAERPEGMAPIDPKVFEAAATGDLKATREILEKSGALEDPAIRGALEHMETGAKMDAVMIERLKKMGVAESEGFRILSNLLEGGYARAPDRLAADVDAMRNPPQPALKSADVDRVINVSRAALDQLRADLPQMVEMAIEARIPEVESVIRTAIKSLGESKADPAKIAKQVADEISAVLSDPKTGPRVADTVRITSGAASASEMAAIVRRSPDLKRYLNPEIDRPRQALALSTLDDASFGRVLSGEIPAPLAAHVADTVNPKHHATVLDDVARAKPQSIDELRQLLDELPPREDAEPLLKSGASGIDDPAGPKAKAQLEAMKVDQAAAIEEATAALKERDKIASKVEGLQGEVAKLVDKPDLSEADAMKLAKARAELAELEPQLERLKADTSPDQAGAQAMYRIAMMAYHQRREADVFRAVNHALELARRITPSDTKIEVKPVLRQDGIVLDAASDIDTGNIALAIRAVDPDARMGHEALHTLVTKGLISPAEVAELAALARENGTFANEAKYREAYADRQNLERQIEEEAAASYVEAVVRGDIKQAENTIANRVKDFIERIKNLLKGYGFKTRDDIVTALLNGDMARREPVRQWMRENDISALAVRPDAGVMFAMADRETGQSMRRDMDALGYVSQALEAARALKQARGTPEQMLAQLRSAGVKQAEIEATNLGQFLDGKKSVTRDEIVAHLEANRVDLREVRYGTGSADQGAVLEAMDAARKSATDPAVADELGELSDALREGYFTLEDLIRGRNAESSDLRPGTRNALEQIEQRLQVQSRLPKWSSYSLDPSNPTYRETVLHLPEAVPSFDDYLAARIKKGTAWENPSPENLAAYRADYDRGDWRNERSRDYVSVKAGEDRNFRSGHFPEPNIVGHMMTSMTKHEGRPVYTIDQIQSDWGQKLRDGGVRDEAKIAKIKEQIASATYDKPVELPKGIIKEELKHAISYLQHYTNLDEMRQYGVGDEKIRAQVEILDQFPREFVESAGELRRLAAELAQAERSASGHPLVNTTDQWVNTTLRRALRQAAEAGADFIAIPHGDTVLSYNPGDEGGMRGFYGSRSSEGIVPKNLRKLLEKLDKDSARPAKVDKLKTPSGTRGYRPDAQRKFDKAETGFTLFPLTDKIKQEVTQRGQVMFAFAGERAKTADLEALARAKKMTADGPKRGNPGYDEHRTRIWTETGWFLGVDGKWKWEIDDSGAVLDLKGALADGWKPNQLWPIDHVLTHKQLQAAYPDLNDRGILYRDFPQGYDDAAAATTKTAGSIALNRRYRDFNNEGAMRSFVLHEGQHIAQRNEGFARGGSGREFTPEEMAAERARLMAIPEDQNSWTIGTVSGDMSDLDVGRSLYRRLAGEVEARAVEKRMNLTPEERRARPPWLDYDVPESEQIVRFADGSGVSQLSYSSEPPVEGFPTIKGNVMFAIRAFHGSPHDFDKFDMSKIGTGEGAQAYGHGLYFAENEGVAKEYRRNLSRGVPHETVANDALIAAGENKANAIDDLRADVANYEGRVARGETMFQDDLDITKRAIEHIQNDGQRPGRMYEVRINASPDDFLDWDKPLSQQSEKVKGALQNVGFQSGQSRSLDQGVPQALRAGASASENASKHDIAGSAILDDIARKAVNGDWGPPGDFARQQATKRLREAGIPGIKYLDQGSRAQGEGSRNYVVFDDSLIEIVAKDGKPIEKAERQSVIDGMMGKKEADGSGPMFAFADPPVTPGLDMSPEARKARAEQMGFDTGTVWYHGTNKDFDAFDLGQFGTNTLTQDETPAIFFTTSPKNAAGYAEGWGAQARDGANIRPVYLRSSNFDEWDLGGGALKPDLLKQAIAEAKADGRDGVIFRRALDMARQVAPGGEASRNAPDVVAVFDPKNIRSINAAFDPANADSPNLMFAMADNAQSEPPRRPIEQDYAVIDRLQKMNELIEACR